MLPFERLVLFQYENGIHDAKFMGYCLIISNNNLDINSVVHQVHFLTPAEMPPAEPRAVDQRAEVVN
jgi:hypothetical protein